MHNLKGNKLQIQIAIDQGPQQPKVPHPLEKGPTLEEKVESAIDNVLSNMDDAFDRSKEEDWCFIRCLFRVLSKKNSLTPKQYAILDKIEPVVRKFAFGIEGAADIDGMDLNKTKGTKRNAKDSTVG